MTAIEESVRFQIRVSIVAVAVSKDGKEQLVGTVLSAPLTEKTDWDDVMHRFYYIRPSKNDEAAIEGREAFFDAVSRWPKGVK